MISSISGAIQSNQLINYSYVFSIFNDAKQHYFRLKQVDLDGSVSYSKIIGSNCNSDVLTYTLYPNPNHGDFLYIDLNTIAESIKIKVFDNKSELIYQSDFNKISHIKVPTNHWKAGLYFIKLTTEDRTYIEKIIR
ncbi:MAG: T9SS type A sorting domain-containing protein [Bacteroidales bacterium]|nr:T9SS type A sorting domain-containing protein [Bacteroidales bacterium]